MAASKAFPGDFVSTAFAIDFFIDGLGELNTRLVLVEFLNSFGQQVRERCARGGRRHMH